MSVSALILGLIHGHIGLNEQVLDVGSILWIQRDADARRHYKAVTAAIKRFSQYVLYAVGYGGGLRFIGKAGEQHDELIAAQAGDSCLIIFRGLTWQRYDIGRPDAEFQSARHALQ